MMKKLGILLVATALFTFVGCKDNKKKSDDAEDAMNNTEETVSGQDSVEEMTPNTLTVMMEPKSGSESQGEVTFTEEDGEVMMEATFTGLKPGPHAIHLHEKADCSSDDGTSTGGHWNPTDDKHGKWGDPEGYHKGDIGNFEADENGEGSITFETDEWCIGCGDENKDIIGKAVIVHEGTDDFVTQPTGDAGGRVSCGGIITE